MWLALGGGGEGKRAMKNEAEQLPIAKTLRHKISNARFCMAQSINQLIYACTIN